MKKIITLQIPMFILLSSGILFSQDHLVISEIVVTPTAGEFIEIYNPTSVSMDLTNYYITDGIFSGDPHPDYVNIVDSTDTPFGSDFLARFPAGSSIDPGEYQVIALNSDFSTQYGFDPDYEMSPNGVDDGDAIPDMLNGGSGIGSNPGLSNAGEVVILFAWDQVSDLVQDVDIALWGDKDEAVDKTGVKKDSKTDADTDSTEYNADTAIADQSVIDTGAHTFGMSWQRMDTEVGETSTGGNGITGHDETSEDVAAAFTEDTPTPGSKLVQIVNVTFQLNTSTNLDTLNENHFVEIRGAWNGQTGPVLPGGKTIDWSSASDLELTNVGGDYWSITFEMEPEDTLNYKFWTGFDPDNGTTPDGGWEGPFNPSNGIDTDTRTFISGNSDSTLDIQYYHPAGPKVDQYWRPFETKPDTVAIYFRVNMGGVTEGQEFDPAVNGPVVVRGGPPVGNIGWDDAVALELAREVASVDSGSFWSGVAYVPKDSITIGNKQEYKFFIRNKGTIDWEGDPNRSFIYTANLVNASMDTTLHWDYFDRRAPVGKEPVEAIITFRVSTEALEQLEFFDRGVGDEIKVIGPKGWSVVVGQPDDFIDMNFIPALQEWTASEPFTLIPGTPIAYKYFVRWDSSRIDPNSPNFIPNLVIRGLNDENEDSGWEEPSVTGGGNRVYVFTSDPQQSPEGDFGFDRAFFNSVPGNAAFSTPMIITWNVDMTPATDPAKNTLGPLFRPGTDSVWVQFDGSLFALSQGFRTFGERSILLKDPDGDMIYSADFVVDPPAWYQLGFILAYSTDTPGSYITNGGGTATGRRYYQFVRPDAILEDLTTVWPSEFVLPVIEWKQEDLPFEQPPDLTTPTSVESRDQGIPRTFALEHNYPNPFNPETTIRYQVAQTANVQIKIYNLMGQVVKTLVDKKQNPGNYKVVWQGDNDQGHSVSSGVYFLKMKAGGFNQTRKMALIR